MYGFMPPNLLKAHNELDKAVDKAYRTKPFTSEEERVEFLFNLYNYYVGNMFEEPKKKKEKNIN